jgi:hypothetical protein
MRDVLAIEYAIVRSGESRVHELGSQLGLAYLMEGNWKEVVARRSGTTPIVKSVSTATRNAGMVTASGVIPTVNRGSAMRGVRVVHPDLIEISETVIECDARPAAIPALIPAGESICLV